MFRYTLRRFCQNYPPPHRQDKENFIECTLCGIMSSLDDDHQMRHSPHVRRILLDGMRCVVVASALINIGPRAHRFLLDFAKDIELIVINPTMPATAEYCLLPGGALEKPEI